MGIVKWFPVDYGKWVLYDGSREMMWTWNPAMMWWRSTSYLFHGRRVMCVPASCCFCCHTGKYEATDASYRVCHVDGRSVGWKRCWHSDYYEISSNTKKYKTRLIQIASRMKEIEHEINHDIMKTEIKE